MFSPTSAFSALPDPPRLDYWPIAIQSAERLRGTVMRCGPGLRAVGWPETPRVRLATLAPWLEGKRVATHLTAAWVWGAARSLGPRIQVSTRVGRRGVTAHNPELRVYEIRYTQADTHQFGKFRVSTPLRTIIDLLYDHAGFDKRERVACRLLTRLVPGGIDEVRMYLDTHPRPYRSRAHERLRAL